VDEKTYTSLSKIFKHYTENSAKKGTSSPLTGSFIHTYIKHGGVIKSKKYYRICSLDSPFYEDLVTAQKRQVAGVKLRVKDYDLFKSLFAYMFPKLVKERPLLFPSDSDVAPSLESLLEATWYLVTRLNELIEKFRIPQEVILFTTTDEDGEGYNLAPNLKASLPTKWYDWIQELDTHKKDIALISVDASTGVDSSVQTATRSTSQTPSPSGTTPSDNQKSKPPHHGLDPRAILNQPPVQVPVQVPVQTATPNVTEHKPATLPGGGIDPRSVINTPMGTAVPPGAVV
jgi:hypothetical protein